MNKDLPPSAKKVHFGVIRSNAERSKHLDVATLHLHGISIDLVNLRPDDLFSSSQEEQQKKFGTPKEDAYRRDLTVNSLFYNINEDRVEDFTELGLKDMQDKYIRTPLEPAVTLGDDACRVIRSIRFSHRFGFKIADEIKQTAIENIQIRVSRLFLR